MAVTVDIEADIKSPADAFWNTIKDIHFLYPKLFPEMYESIEILEGDGRSAGTIHLVTCPLGFIFGRSFKLKILSVNEEKKCMNSTVVEGDPLKFYKFLAETISVKEKGNGVVACKSLTYEKATKNAIDGELMRTPLVGMLQKLDAYTLANMNKN